MDVHKEAEKVTRDAMAVANNPGVPGEVANTLRFVAGKARQEGNLALTLGHGQRIKNSDVPEIMSIGERAAYDVRQPIAQALKHDGATGTALNELREAGASLKAGAQQGKAYPWAQLELRQIGTNVGALNTRIAGRAPNSGESLEVVRTELKAAATRARAAGGIAKDAAPAIPKGEAAVAAGATTLTVAGAAAVATGQVKV